MQANADDKTIEEETPNYETQLEDWLNNYKSQAEIYRIFNSVFQIIIAVGSALTAFTVIYPDIPKLVPAIISFLVVLATVLTNYYQFDRASMAYQKTFDAMTDERNYFHAGVNNYKGLNPTDALEGFMERINTLKNGRLSVWSAASTK